MVNGNVERFTIAGNYVHDVNNIGIDVIGGETGINPLYGTRAGVVRGNRVERARSSYGGGFGAGLYVDGGRDLLLEANVITECDLGLEVGAENAGWNATGVVVRGNLVARNDKAGIVFGGYDATVGRVRFCEFVNNTCYQNDTTGQFLGELWIQWASDNVVRNNIFYATSQNVLLYSENGNVNNALEYNLYFSPGGANGSAWVWRSQSYGTFQGYRNGSGQDAHSRFAQPAFADADAGDFGLLEDSPAIDAAAPEDQEDALDLAGYPRWLDGDLDGALRTDVGAREYGPATLAVSGAFTPGGTVTVEVSGRTGLALTLYAGFPGSTLLPAFGYLAVDLARPHDAAPYGTIPATRTATIPARIPVGTALVVQALAAAGPAGALSNPVSFAVE